MVKVVKADIARWKGQRAHRRYDEAHRALTVRAVAELTTQRSATAIAPLVRAFVRRNE